MTYGTASLNQSIFDVLRSDHTTARHSRILQCEQKRVYSGREKQRFHGRLQQDARMANCVPPHPEAT